jgi:hypothetical protein
MIHHPENAKDILKLTELMRGAYKFPIGCSKGPLAYSRGIILKRGAADATIIHRQKISNILDGMNLVLNKTRCEIKTVNLWAMCQADQEKMKKWKFTCEKSLNQDGNEVNNWSWKFN